MRKSKLLATIVLTLLLTFCGGMLAACNTKHTHAYSSGWEKDSTGHWHVATCDDLKKGDEGYIKDFADHIWGDDDKCDICDYERASTPVKTEFTIKLDANGGTLEGGKETSDVETKNNKIETLPSPTAPEGMEFVGWFTEQDGGTEVTAETSFTANGTVYAQYIFVYTITLNANGGTLETATVKAKSGKIAELPTPTAPEGKQFAGWYTESEGGTEVTTATVFDEDTTIYAQYASVYTITLVVGEDGTLPEGTETTLTTKGGKLEALPTPETSATVVFLGWYTQETDGEQVTTDTRFTGETLTITLYARYRQEIVVTFNVGDGALPEGATSTLVTTENKIAELPVAVAPANQWFKGWYTAETGGVEVSATTDLGSYAVEHAVTLYARYVNEVTVTLEVPEGYTLPEGAVTTYQTVNGKIQLPEGEKGLPAVQLNDLDHWVFFGWYDGNTLVNVDTKVFAANTTLKAKVGRENGVWIGDTFKHALSVNSGSTTRVEYWLGGSEITLQKDEVISLYIDGQLISHFVEQNSAGIVKPGEAEKVTSVKVSVAGPFSIYLHKNASDWSCEYSGPTAVNVATEVPEGCDEFKVTIGTNVITFYLVDSDGNAVSKDNFGDFVIYTYSDEIFGNWAGSTTNGKVKAEMTGSGTKIPNGWIFRWGSGYASQTANITGVFKNGKTYLIELPSATNGEATISEVNLAEYTVTIDLNYAGQPEEKATLTVRGGKLTLPADPVRDDYDFAGWYTAATNGTQITDDYVVGEDMSIYAHWTQKIQVTLNYNYEGSAAPVVVKANKGKLSPLPTAPARDGYYLDGWYTEAEGGTKITTSYVFEADTTIYAHWGERVDVTVTINYNYEGCADPETVQITAANDHKIVPFPVAPERDGYEFLGWYTTAVDTADEQGELITADTEIVKTMTIYARYAKVYTVTLNVGTDGTLPTGAVTTYKVLDGKIVLPEGVTGLPTVTVAAHWKFLGWYNGTTAVNVATTVFDADTTLTAKVVRDDGVWVGTTFKNALTINAGSTTRTEYWLGGVKLTLAKGDKMSLYINGELIRHFVEENSGGIDKPAASAQVTEVTVSVAGPFEIYLHKNANDWSCQYAGPSEVIVGSEVPAGCDAFTVTIGSNKPITFFLKDGTGKAVGNADFGKFAIYCYNSEIFGSWANSVSATYANNGIIKENMTASGSMPDGWIFRWGSGYTTQTADIKGAFAFGKAYLVELPSASKGAHKITELTINAIYTITFDQNYEGQPETKVTGKAYNGKLTSLPTFTLAGNEDKDLFWYTAKEGGEKVTLNTVFTADTTVYARWSDKVQITPNLNYEGADAMTAITVNLGQLSTMPANPTRAGYEFLGWFTAAEGGDRVTTDTVFEANSSIYAHWRVPFTVTFNLNYDGCAEAEVKTATVVAGETYSKLTTLGTNPTRDGYEFLGWFSAAEGGDRITTATTYEGNTVIYAQWRVPFKVTLDLNYTGCDEATVKTANVVSGQTYSRLTSTDVYTPVREGYDFLGWYPNADGSGTKLTQYINIEGDVTYYASWRLPIEVTLDLNYTGAAAATKQTATLVSGQTYSRLTAAQFADPTREGYDFLGWYPNADGSGTKLTATTNLTVNVTYYASWRLPIEVTFDLNDEGTAEPTKVIATLVSGQTYSRLTAAQIVTPEREGYDFLGWYNTNAATGGTKLSTTTNLTANVTYYARWKEVVKVTFNLNYDGAADPTVVNAVWYNTTATTATSAYSRVTLPADPVRDSYDFLGWYPNTDGTGTKLSATTSLYNSTTYYAKWKVKFVVTFDLNYEGQPEDKATLQANSYNYSATSSRLAALPADPTREGYEFVGWYNTNAATGGTKLTTTTSITANVTYYARWTALPVVTFDLNDGEVHETNATLTVNAEKKLTAFITEPTRDGYTFAGWFTAAEDGEAVTLEKTYSADTTVYAHWTAVTE